MTKNHAQYLLDKNSLARKIVNVIRTDKAKTPTEIASELNTSHNSINNYLRDLRKKNFVEKIEKDGRNQPYEVTHKVEELYRKEQKIIELRSEIRELVDLQKKNDVSSENV